ncbi:hypothetical protein [Halobellus ruber]|uniref:Domain of unknown function domain-containing protein n=1 Tax=Halobellus ruber TaxID=2761102 RepID=A0A7J9SEW9_9EURY|nr:hypothetical protein [Halobellus ruber]MBB6645062.1 hypothetical protein [Halobellus ruber]
MKDGTNVQPSSADKSTAIDRVRGILTVNDRQILRTGELERNSRYRIRRRLRSSLLDWPIIDRHLPEGDLERVVENHEDMGAEVIISGLSVMYQMAADLSDKKDYNGPLFEDLLAEAISRSEDESGSITKTDISIEVKHSEPELKEIKQKLETDQATTEEYQYFAKKGNIKGFLQQRVDSGRSLFLRTPKWSDNKIIELDPKQELRKYK